MAAVVTMYKLAMFKVIKCEYNCKLNGECIYAYAYN